MIRESPNGSFEVRVTKRGLLPEPLYFTFASTEDAADCERALLRS